MIWGGRRPLGSNTEGGEINLAPSVFCFWQVTPTRQTQSPKFRIEIETRMRQRPFCFVFFGLHLNLRTKFRTEMELLSLTKLRKNISSIWNLLYQQKIDAYPTVYSVLCYSAQTCSIKHSVLQSSIIVSTVTVLV